MLGVARDAPEDRYAKLYLDVEDAFTGDKESLRPGLEVEFEAQQGDKGPCAVAVVQPGGKPGPARARPPAPRGLIFVLGLILGAALGALGHLWLTRL